MNQHLFSQMTMYKDFLHGGESETWSLTEGVCATDSKIMFEKDKLQRKLQGYTFS